MADVFSKDKRSSIMRKVKSEGNKSTELKLLSLFKDNNIKGWRRNYKIYGKPDFVFLKHKIAVFCDGCFWHGHNCRNVKPKENAEYWGKKIKTYLIGYYLTSKKPHNFGLTRPQILYGFLSFVAAKSFLVSQSKCDAILWQFSQNVKTPFYYFCRTNFLVSTNPLFVSNLKK